MKRRRLVMGTLLQKHFGMFDDVPDSSAYRLSYYRDEVKPGSEACEAAAALNHNYIIWAIKLLMSLESIAGIGLCIFISFRIFKHEIFHINQRILLVLIGLLLTVRALYSLYKEGWMLHRVLTITNTCDLMWHTRYCWDISTVVSEPAFAVGYCYLAISVERLVACVFGAKYENKSSPLLAIIAVFAIVANIIIVSYGHYTSFFLHPPPLHPNSTFVVFCTSVAFPKIRWIDILYMFRQFPVMSLSLLIFTPVFIYTKHKNRLRVTDSTHSLDDRFHRRMTLKSARIVYPNMICFSVIYAVSSACTTLCAYLQTDGAQVTLAIEFGSLVFNAHMVAHPLILIWREPLLWRNERKQIEDPALAHNATRHFNIVQDAWNQVQFDKEHEKEHKPKEKNKIRVKRGLRGWIHRTLARGNKTPCSTSLELHTTPPA